MNTLRQLIDRINLKLFGSRTRFKKDDTVQHVTGGPLMVVLSVKCIKKNTPSIVSCKWYDREQKSIQTSNFSEDELKVFDWYERP